MLRKVIKNILIIFPLLIVFCSKNPLQSKPANVIIKNFESITTILNITNSPYKMTSIYGIILKNIGDETAYSVSILVHWQYPNEYQEYFITYPLSELCIPNIQKNFSIKYDISFIEPHKETILLWIIDTITVYKTPYDGTATIQQINWY